MILIGVATYAQYKTLTITPVPNIQNITADILLI